MAGFLIGVFLGVVFVLNAGEARTPVLAIGDLALAVWFLGAAAVYAWEAARKS